MTIARAETSNNAQNSESEVTAAKGVSIALIGPNDAHRKTVAHGLASAPGRKVHEFIDYPADLNDLPRMAEQNFDVVLVDVDTDQSYALQIIEKLSSLGISVMAYSARTDQDLLMNCMRAGACDFVPLPTDNQPEPERAPQPQPPVQQVVPKPPAPKPAPVPAPPAARTITPVVPERRFEPVSEVRPAPVPEEYVAPPAQEFNELFTPPVQTVEAVKGEARTSDFAAWDAVNLRPTPVPPAVKKSDGRLRPSLVTERKKSEPVLSVVPAIEEKFSPTPAVERPPVNADIFRSNTFRSESEPNEVAEKQGANWVKWILIAAGPLVLGLVLLVVFTRQSTSTAAPPPAKEAPVAAPVEKEVLPGSQLIVNATGKTGAKTPAVAKPAPGAEANAPAAQDPTPVSPDAMAAQLVAPSRIAGSIKKAAPSDEAPPTAPAAVAFDDSGAIPGSVFSNSAKAKVAPHVVAISAGLADGMILRKTQPVYPKFAQEAHISGKVVLKATITKQGTIEGVQVVSGPKILAPSAVEAVRTWQYRPYMLDGQPVSVETSITIVFGTTK
jgi:periplasmic protein TonB